MDKPALLSRLSIMRARAEAAHLEVVIRTALVSNGEKHGGASRDLKFQLSHWQMTEQKLLRELDWVLDQLDRFDRTGVLAEGGSMPTTVSLGLVHD